MLLKVILVVVFVILSVIPIVPMYFWYNTLTKSIIDKEKLDSFINNYCEYNNTDFYISKIKEYEKSEYKDCNLVNEWYCYTIEATDNNNTITMYIDECINITQPEELKRETTAFDNVEYLITIMCIAGLYIFNITIFVVLFKKLNKSSYEEYSSISILLSVFSIPKYFCYSFCSFIIIIILISIFCKECFVWFLEIADPKILIYVLYASICLLMITCLFGCVYVSKKLIKKTISF
jgi:hypothetical protein